jgi:hypothetical protein
MYLVGPTDTTSVRKKKSCIAYDAMTANLLIPELDLDLDAATVGAAFVQNFPSVVAAFARLERREHQRRGYAECLSGCHPGSDGGVVLSKDPGLVLM